VASSAERLFDDARAAMLARRYDEACAKFAESQRLDPASGTLLNLAVCHEAQGRTATAWTEYKATIAMSRSDGNAERERIANTRMQALEPALCHLTLIPPQGADSDLVITLDGAGVDRTNWGIPMPVDPGAHALKLSAAHKRPWSRSISLEAGSSRALELPALENAPESPKAKPPPTAKAPAESSSLRTTSTVVLGATGLVALGVAGYFGLRAKAEWDDRNDHCTDGCDDEAVAAHDRAEKYALIADVSAGVGIVALGVSAYLVISAPSKPPADPRGRSAGARERVFLAVGGAF
jgi:hypothetical protein